MAATIPTALASTSSLVALDLTNNNLDDAGVKCLADGLAQNSSLRVLKLSGNQLSPDGGVQAVRSMLVRSRVCQIKSLDLADDDQQLRFVMGIRDEFATVGVVCWVRWYTHNTDHDLSLRRRRWICTTPT